MNKVYVLYGFGLFVVALAVGIPAISWISPVVYVLFFPVAAVWFWTRDGHSIRDLGFRNYPGWYRSLIGGLLFGLAIPISLQGIQVLSGWAVLSPREEPLGDLPIYLLRVLIQMALVVAIEEFVFRGYFFQVLQPKVGVWPAMLLASFLWGLGHITSMIKDGLSPIQIIIGLTTFLFWGIALGIGYWKSGKSLWLPFGIHFGLNVSFSLVGWFLMIRDIAPDWWMGHPAWSPESGLIGVLVWIVIAFILWWRMGNEKKSEPAKSLQ